MIPEDITVEQLQAFNPNTLMEHLGMEFTAVGSDFIEAKMPVDHRTHQPVGFLHGGASAALAESLGSCGSALIANLDDYFIFGTELNASHVKSARNGWVTGRATVLKAGSSQHVWEIKVCNEAGDLLSICRLTVRVIPKKK